MLEIKPLETFDSDFTGIEEVICNPQHKTPQLHAGVEVPVADALFTIAEQLVGGDLRLRGRTATAMGIEGLTREQLLRKVRG